MVKNQSPTKSTICGEVQTTVSQSRFRNARLFIILFVRNFWRVCSQFWLSVRNSVWGPFNRNSRGNPSFCWLGGGGLSGKKKSTKIKFLGPETARWGGGLPREGVVAKNFVPALETLSSLGFEERNPGCPGNFAGMSRTPGGVQKVCAKKTSCAFFVP